MVCTEVFENLALGLGAPADRLVTVPHPLLELTEDEVRSAATAAALTIRSSRAWQLGGLDELRLRSA